MYVLFLAHIPTTCVCIHIISVSILCQFDLFVQLFFAFKVGRYTGWSVCNVHGSSSLSSRTLRVECVDRTGRRQWSRWQMSLSGLIQNSTWKWLFFFSLVTFHNSWVADVCSCYFFVLFCNFSATLHCSASQFASFMASWGKLVDSRERCPHQRRESVAADCERALERRWSGHP